MACRSEILVIAFDFSSVYYFQVDLGLLKVGLSASGNSRRRRLQFWGREAEVSFEGLFDDFALCELLLFGEFAQQQLLLGDLKPVQPGVLRPSATAIFKMIINKIRELQDKQPFESFALELSNGRVIQIYDPCQVATSQGERHGEAAIGILYRNGCFEVLDASHVASVSVGVHVKVQEELQQKMDWAKKVLGAGEEQSS